MVYYIMEEWRQISDFPNYSVSNFGNVMNNKTNKMLRLCNKSGYYNISLTNDNNYKTFKVHRLVALAFIENIENYDGGISHTLIISYLPAEYENS